MGRKPNPIATEFFIRGRKLDDASNRYEQTCKFCNERFPKGRVDTLVAHILKRCAAIPLQDRRRAALHLDTPSHLSDATAESYDANPQFAGLSLQTDPGLTALETLAEVSRHHLDYQSHGLATGISVDQSLDGDANNQPPQKKRRIQSRAKERVFSLQQRPLHEFNQSTAPSHYHEVTDADAQKLAAALYEAHTLQEIDPTAEFLVQDDAGEPNAEVRTVPGQDSDAVSTALQLAASAASELMAPQAIAGTEAADQGGSNPLTRLRFNAQDSMIDPQLHANNKEYAPNGMATATSLAPLISRTPSLDLIMEQRKQKARSKFSESRRKEVQKMRKLGACMRCRMLKKPCSDGTPCRQCTKIDSARLWKQPCIRTRLQDELGLWSCGLFTVKAFKTTFKIRELLYLDALPGRIEVTAFPDVNLWLALTGLRSVKLLSNDLDPAILTSERIPNITDVHCIATETEDVLAKVERYLHSPAYQHHHWEPSAYMNATLEVANRIALEQPALLLRSVIELWLSTKILCGDLPLHIAINTAAHASDQPIILDTASRAAILQPKGSKTYEIISTQILSAVEKHASALARTVLTELERRLVQRQQSQQAEIFIVSVVLISCVERMCRLYDSFDAQRKSGVEDTPDGAGTAPGAKHHYTLTDPALQHLEDQLLLAAGPSDAQLAIGQLTQDWPLERPPEHYHQQGDRFADILNMLLQMRDITPTTAVDEAGFIEATGDDVRASVSEWLAAVQVTDEQLTAAAREGGAMKYLSKLLGR